MKIASLFAFVLGLVVIGGWFWISNPSQDRVVRSDSVKADKKSPSATVVEDEAPKKQATIRLIDQKWRELLAQEDNDERLIFLQAVLDGFSPEEIELFFERVVLAREQNPSQDWHNEIEVIVSSWSRLDATSAVSYLMDDYRGWDSQLLASLAFVNLVHQDSLLARERLMDLPEGWDSADFWDAYLQGDTNLNWIEKATWVRSLSSDEDGYHAMYFLMKHWAKQNGPEASEWLQQSSDIEERNEYARVVGESWAHLHPQSAAAWAWALPQGFERGHILGDVIAVWAKQDVVASGEFVNQLEWFGDLDIVVSSYVDTAAQSDPEIIMGWARSIEEPQLRMNSIRRITEKWIQKNPESIFDWMQSASLENDEKQAVVEVWNKHYPEQ